MAEGNICSWIKKRLCGIDNIERSFSDGSQMLCPWIFLSLLQKYIDLLASILNFHSSGMYDGYVGLSITNVGFVDGRRDNYVLNFY
jgi:hypothetical protein